MPQVIILSKRSVENVAVELVAEIVKVVLQVAFANRVVNAKKLPFGI